MDEMDSDINDSVANLKAVEAAQGHSLGVPQLVQTESDMKVESDPICSSAGCDQRYSRLLPYRSRANGPGSGVL